MEEYVDEAEEVSYDEDIGESYSLEWALKDEGKKEGILEGKIKGKLEGKLEAKRQSILKILPKKLNRILPLELENSIKNADLEKLEELEDKIFEINSIEDVKKILS